MKYIIYQNKSNYLNIQLIARGAEDNLLNKTKNILPVTLLLEKEKRIKTAQKEN